MSNKAKQPTRAELLRKCRELEAQLAHVPYFASSALDKASSIALMGSAVIVQLHALGGREICAPFAIRDGLSSETIAALKGDLLRTYELATMYKTTPDKIKVQSCSV